jgi:hypothetical protein
MQGIVVTPVVDGRALDRLYVHARAGAGAELRRAVVVALDDARAEDLRGD